MNIAGIEQCSFVDWPGRMTAVVFTPGCNLDCYYCHNRLLLNANAALVNVTKESVLDWIATRLGFLDGIVISGGEPTLQQGLAAFIDEVRALGFPLKLDTNGTLPEALAELLHSGRIDYVAMDIKAPRHTYDDVCGAPVDQNAVDRSIRLIMQAGVEYEFRTTVLPQFTEDDILDVARRIGGAERYILQPFRRPPPAADRIDLRLARTPLPFRTIQEMARKAAQFVHSCETRGLVLSSLQAIS